MRTDPFRSHERRRRAARLGLALLLACVVCLVLLLPGTVTWMAVQSSLRSSIDITEVPIGDQLGFLAAVTTYPIVWSFCYHHIYVPLEIMQLILVNRLQKAGRDSLSPSLKQAQAGRQDLTHLSVELVSIRQDMRWLVWKLVGVAVLLLLVCIWPFLVAFDHLFAGEPFPWNIFWVGGTFLAAGLALARFVLKFRAEVGELGPEQPEIDEAIAQANSAIAINAALHAVLDRTDQFTRGPDGSRPS